LPGSPEALEMDKDGRGMVGGSAEQRREKLDSAIMAANPFNSDRLIRMYSNVDIYVKEGARFMLFLVLLLSAYTYRRNVNDEYAASASVRARFNQPFGYYSRGQSDGSSQQDLSSLSADRQGIISVKTEEMFWQWLMGPCKRTLFPTTNMNGNLLKEEELYGYKTRSRSGGQFSLVGPVRLKQHRVSIIVFFFDFSPCTFFLLQNANPLLI
jgi:hypothetical protein